MHQLLLLIFNKFGSKAGLDSFLFAKIVSSLSIHSKDEAPFIRIYFPSMLIAIQWDKI